jgi:hypothetical protein
VARRVTRRMGASLSWFWRTLRLVNAGALPRHEDYCDADQLFSSFSMSS